MRQNWKFVDETRWVLGCMTECKIRGTNISECPQSGADSSLLLNSQLVTEAVTARALSVSTRTLRNWRKELGLPHRNISGRIRYRMSEVLQFLAENHGVGRGVQTTGIHAACSCGAGISNAGVSAEAEGIMLNQASATGGSTTSR